MQSMNRTLVRVGTAMIAVGALLGSLSGCAGAAGGTPSSASDDTVTVAFSSSAVDENTQGYIDQMRLSIPSIEKSEGVKVDLEVYDAQLSVDKQISDIQTALVKHPDVLLVDPVDPAGIVPAVQAARDQGVKTINYRPSDNDPDPDLYDAKFVFSVEDGYADAMRTWIQGLLDADPSLVLNTAVIYGAQAQTAQLTRGDVVKDMAAADPDHIKVVAEKFGDWAVDVSQNATADFLIAHPDLNLVVAANNAMALGASNAVISAGKQDQVKIAGYDIDVPTIQNVMDGKVDLQVGIDGRRGAYAFILAAVQLATSGWDGELSLGEIYAVTPDNAAEVIKVFDNPLE